MIKNPFPGPQPYRSSDRKLFYGRDDLARKLEAVILATRCITVHGPSGAGKSSLVQAAVLPTLMDTRDVRVVRVDAWPEREAPDSWLARAVYSDLRMGQVAPEHTPAEAVLNAAKRAARGSDRLLIIYLDQMEQLFFPGRSSDETDSFFGTLQALVDLPVRSLRVILSLREDYLGRFRDRVRDRARLLENTFRVGPLTVEELTSAVCQAALAGEPPQEWSADTMRTLMLQVRVPGQAASDDAEAQAAYAQIVCRALFQERAQGQTSNDDTIEAEPILRRYFDSTLSSLGPLRTPAQRLLEDHLVSTDGSRTLRTEKELLRILPQNELSPILKALEGAAILHAEEHQGSRYFEIGHDWLARKVFDERREREARRLAEERQRQFDEQQKVAAAERAQAAKERRRLLLLAAGAVGFAVITSALGIFAWRARTAAEAARRQATKAQLEAVRKRIDASDQRLLSGYAALVGTGQPAQALKLLPEVKFPALLQGWLSIASDALSENTLLVTLSGHSAPLATVEFSPDGKRILTASSDGTARIWNSDGNGVPIVFSGHHDAILTATWSPDGSRILTTSGDGTACIVNADGRSPPTTFSLNAGPVWAGVFSPDGTRVVLGAQDGSIRIAAVDGNGRDALELPAENPSGLRVVAFFPDNRRVLGAANNGAVHVWTIGDGKKPLELSKHDQLVQSLAVSRDGTKVLLASGEASAKLFFLKGDKVENERLLSCGQGQAIQAALNADATLAAITCNDLKVRVYSTLQETPPVILEGATAFITHLAFRPDGQFIAVASRDSVTRVYSVHGGAPRLELRGHLGGIGSISFRPDGKRLVSGASDERSRDFTARVWNMESLDAIPAPPRDALPHHAIAIRHDGKQIAAAFDDNTVRIRSADGHGAAVELKGHTQWISRISWSPDGTRVASASFDMTARIWRADGTGEPIILGGPEHDGHTGGLRHAIFDPSGTFVATASEDRTAKVWLANRSDKPIATFRGHEDWVTSIAFDPSGKRIATGSQDKQVRLFSIDAPGNPIVFRGHQGGINSVRFSPDGTRIASASEDGTVRIFSADGAAAPIILNSNGGNALQLAVWSSNGRRVAAASSNHWVYLWDADGTSEASVLTPPQKVIALHFMDDDNSLLAVLNDGSTQKWRIDIPGLVDALRTANGDCLQPSMRHKFLEEDDDCAMYAFAQCESAHGRRAAPPELAHCQSKSVMAELERLSIAVKTDTDEAAKDRSWFDDWWRSSAPQAPTMPEIDGGIANKSLQDLGPDGCHGRVVVLPGDAEVDIDDAPVRRRDGAVDLLGKCGEIIRLRVRKPGQYIEAEVKLESNGVTPPVIVLPPRPPPNGDKNVGKDRGRPPK